MNTLTVHLCTCGHENIRHRANYADTASGVAFTGRCLASDDTTGQTCTCNHYEHGRTERRPLESEVTHG